MNDIHDNGSERDCGSGLQMDCEIGPQTDDKPGSQYIVNRA